jgi:hypothetical protein
VPAAVTVGESSGAASGSLAIAFAMPKSRTFAMPSGVTFDVGGLQIAMHDPAFVRGFERLGDLPRQAEALGDAEAAPHSVGQRLALDELEDDAA